MDSTGENTINREQLPDDTSQAIAQTPRARSSLRQRYEAEARVIERRLGGLEAIRGNLGLSQRKMAQLLLVDPSAWTRWTQDDSAPPHVWRALAWYMALQEKYPALDAKFWLEGVARSADADRISENADEIRAQRLLTHSLEMKIKELKNEIEILKITANQIGTEKQDADAHERNSGGETQSARAQAETRAIANAFIAITFATFGYFLSWWISK